MDVGSGLNLCPKNITAPRGKLKKLKPFSANPKHYIPRISRLMDTVGILDTNCIPLHIYIYCIHIYIYIYKYTYFYIQ